MKLQIKQVIAGRESVCRDYALIRGRLPERPEKIDWNAERERMKAALLPYVKEIIKKQLKEEREYYRSRPSLAAKQLENLFGAGKMAHMIVPEVTVRVYEQIEERIRRERLRRG